MGYWTTRGYANSRIANLRSELLTDWTSCRLVNSWTRQLADWASRGLGNSQMPPMTLPAYLSFFWPFIETASCLVRELISPRDVQSTSWQSASWCIRKLSSYPAMLSCHVYVNVPALISVDRCQDSLYGQQCCLAAWLIGNHMWPIERHCYFEWHWRSFQLFETFLNLIFQKI